MEIYLYNSNNELLQEFHNVIHWGNNFVEYNNGGRCKIYCRENEYFTNKMMEVKDGNE